MAEDEGSYLAAPAAVVDVADKMPTGGEESPRVLATRCGAVPSSHPSRAHQRKSQRDEAAVRRNYRCRQSYPLLVEEPSVYHRHSVTAVVAVWWPAEHSAFISGSAPVVAAGSDASSHGPHSGG